MVAFFAIAQPIKVLPRIRVAPGYAMVDQNDGPLTSETQRGMVTLYAFAPIDCGDRCEAMNATMREVSRRVAAGEADLGDTELALVTIALADAPGPDALAAEAERSGADGAIWRWAGADWDHVRTVVGAGFRRYFSAEADGTIDFDPGFALVDGNGVLRGEYRYRTKSTDADRLVGQIGVLGTELRNSGGAAGLAYEAAHLFSCYG